MPFQEVAQDDFSGGVNAVTNPSLVTKKQVARVRNFLLDEHGSLRTRDGYSLHTTAPTSTTPLVYESVLNTTAGTAYSYAIQATTGAAYTFYRVDAEPWTTVSTAINPEPLPQSVTVVDRDLVAVGYSTPLLYNGTTLVPITAAGGQTVPPGAKHVAFHLGYPWVWNTNPTTTALDGPSSLRAGDANDPNSWPNASQVFISKDDGQVGMGLAVYTIAETGISPVETMIAFKNYSAYQVTGVFGASNFSVQKVKSDMGCIAPRTIQFVSGFGIVRLTHKGFALYNGVDDRLISEEVRPYIFGHDEIQGLNMTSINLSWAAQSQSPPLYIAACPVSGTALTRFFAYDLVRRAWTILDFPVNFACLAMYQTPTTQPHIHGCTAASGQILHMFSGDTTDGGAAINWSFQTRSFSLGSSLRPSYWRRMILKLLYTPNQPVSTTTTLGGFVPSPLSWAVYGSAVYGSSTYYGVSGAPSQTVTYAGTAPAASLYGSAVYGSSTYSAASAATIERRQSFDILRTASSVTVTVSGTGVVRVRGLAFHASPKPLTRMVEVA